VGIFVISGGASSLPMTSLPKRASRDLRVLVTTPVAFIVALLFLGVATSAVALFPREEPRSLKARQATPITDQQRSEFEKWWEMQPRVQVPYTVEGAKVVVVKFNDYQCPPCKQTYEAYEPILTKYEPRGVKYIMRHFPLNPQCNSAVKVMVHTAACDAAAAAVMAKSKGTYDKLTAWLFANQETLSPATVRDAAKTVGGITDFDAQYEKALQEVKTDASTGAVLGVTSTPTFFVNGRMLKGGLPAQYFEAAIELELQHNGSK
jgi:predicted DsbA family dithiol-disulfide isomerase